LRPSARGPPLPDDADAGEHADADADAGELGNTGDWRTVGKSVIM